MILTDAQRTNVRGIYPEWSRKGTVENMKIYDITQEMFSGKVYPGDTAPQYTRVKSIEDGNNANVTDMKICVHNGTHMDAPFHFLSGGRTIDHIELEKCIGEVSVIRSIEDYTGEKRVILLSEGSLDMKSAGILAESGAWLVGIGDQSVGDADVHRLILGKEIVVLEGLKLDGIQPGKYTLFAAPLKLGGCDGSPCRAVLISGEV